jgi:heme-degrading monooxygenase HmoA
MSSHIFAPCATRSLRRNNDPGCDIRLLLFERTGLDTLILTRRRNSDDHRNRTNRRQAGTEKDFEAAVAKARPLFLRAKGGKGFELHKSIEKPQRYRLMAQWETLENHTVDFRGSEDFTAWRALVGQYFAAPPRSSTPRRC